MQPKIKKGSGFTGACSYVLKKENAQLISSNMMSENAADLGREFRDIAGSKCKKPVFHVSLSQPSGERLSEEKWAIAIDQYLADLGFSNSQYIAVRHSDTDHDHVHVIANRVDFDLKIVSDKNDFRKSNKSCALIEKTLNLTQSAHQKSDRLLSALESSKRVDRSERHTGATAEILALKIDNAISAYLDFAARELNFKFSPIAFEKHCENAGLAVQFNKAKGGAIRGISFSISGGRGLSGAKIRRDLSLGSIRKRFTPAKIKGLRIGEIEGASERLAADLKKSGFEHAEKTDYGVKARVGNWRVAISDRRDSVAVFGVPNQKIAALIALKTALEKGWSAVEINVSEPKLKLQIQEMAASVGIKIIEKSLENKVNRGMKR